MRVDAGGMNGLERRWAQELELRRISPQGDVAWWRFGSIKLRLANRTWYCPDFVVCIRDGTVEMHEVKGHWEDDARVKWKVAAEQFCAFRFLAITRRRGEGWGFEARGPAGLGSAGLPGYTRRIR